MTTHSCHRTAISIDNTGSSSGGPARSLYLDQQLHTALGVFRTGALAKAVHIRHDGDSATIAVDPSVPGAWVLSDLVLREFRLAVAEINRPQRPEYRLKLRVAVDHGETTVDLPSFAGEPVCRAARLREAPALRAAMAAPSCTADVGVILSDRFHADVVLGGQRGLDRSMFQPVEVQVKDYSGRGWIHLPGEAPTSSAADSRAAAAGSPSTHIVFEQPVDLRYGVVGVVNNYGRD